MTMVLSPRERFEVAARMGVPDKVPFMPFFTGHYVSWFAGVEEGDYWPALEKKLYAYLKVQERWPDLMLYPGIYIDMSVAVEPSALGAPIFFPPDASPQVEHIANEPDLLMALEPADPWKDGLMPKALETHQYLLDHCPKRWIDDYGYLAGSYSCLGPTDVAGLLIGYDNFMRHIYRKPSVAHHLMDVATETLIRYLRAFERIGGPMHRFQVADDSLAFLSPRHFTEFSLPYLKRIFDEFKGDAVGILHCDTNATHLLDVIADIGMDVYNFGPEMDIAEVKEKVGDRVCLFGNIDPLADLLKGTPGAVEAESRRILDAAKPKGGFIFTMGSGTARGTPSENIDAIQAVIDQYGRYDV